MAQQGRSALLRMQVGPFPIWMPLVAYVVMSLALILPSLLPMSPVQGQILQFLLNLFWAVGLAFVFARGRLQEVLGAQIGPGGIWRLGLVVLGISFVIWGVTAEVAASEADVAKSTERVLRAMGLGQSAGHDFLLVLGICVLAPLSEEVVFRGLLFKGLYDGMNRLPGGYLRGWPAVLIAAVVAAELFASAHGGEGQEASVQLVLVLHGVLYAVAYAVTGSLWAPILAHALNNCIALGEALLRPEAEIAAQLPILPMLALMMGLAVLFLWLWQGAVRGLDRITR